MELTHKTFEGEVTVKDAEQGIVRAVVGRVGVKDLEDDVFLPGSFGRQNVRVSAFGHASWPHRGNLPLVGRGVIEERGDEVVAEVKFFLQTQAGREHFEVVKELSDLQQWSFGFHPSRAETGEAPPTLGAVRNAYTRVPVEEVSPVLLAASIGTRTIAIKCDACEAKAKAEEEAPEEPEEPAAEEEAPEAEAVAEADEPQEPEPEEPQAEAAAEKDEEPEEPSIAEQIAREVGRAEALRAARAGV